MRFSEAVKEIQRRTGHRYNYETEELTRDAGIPLGDGSGILHDYQPNDVERAVLWQRMRFIGGSCSGGSTDVRLRRSAQNAIPFNHEPGWIVLTQNQTYFTADPLPTVFGHGAMVIPIHDDCSCV